MDEKYALLCDGELGTLEESWQAHLGLLGKDVHVDCLDGEQHGRLLEIAFDGLILDNPAASTSFSRKACNISTRGSTP